MSDFLDAMAQASRERLAAARAKLPRARLRAQALERPAPPALSLSGSGFDLIAEVKLRSPSAGTLADEDTAALGRRAAGYARAGAAAVSVLTEPSRFGGDLAHLREVAQALAPVQVPAMRKDFLVDPYQVWEARAAGAGGVLLIVRMLPGALLGEMLAVAREAGLFVLVEAFDRDDIRRLANLPGLDRADTLVGVNCRDLATLEIDPPRLAELASALPAEANRVAESGMTGPDDVAAAAAAGYALALVGTALMRGGDATATVAAMLQAGRAAVPAAGIEERG